MSHSAVLAALKSHSVVQKRAALKIEGWMIHYEVQYNDSVIHYSMKEIL